MKLSRFHVLNHCRNRTVRDIASYGVVRMLGETRWEPKQVYHAMAARYERG